MQYITLKERVKPLEINGSKYICTVIIQLDRISRQRNREKQPNNGVRSCLNPGVIDNIANSFSLNGQITNNQPLMVVKKLPKNIVGDDGKMKTYEIVDGHHRYEAAVKAKLKKLTVDVFEFDSRKDEFLYQVQTNNHSSRAIPTAKDLEQTLLTAVKEGYVENDKDSMEKFLKETSCHIHGSTRKKAVAMAMRNLGTYTDFLDYNPEDIELHAKKHGYVVNGNYDVKTKEFGWSVKEGYESRYVQQSILRFGETGSPSYLVCHSNSPNKKFPTLDAKRTNTENIVDKHERAFIRAAEYYNKTGKVPFRIKGFLPQDTVTEYEKGLIEK